MCPDTTIRVSSYYYACVLILCMCPHTHISLASSHHYVSSVLILLCMCTRTTIYVSCIGPVAAMPCCYYGKKQFAEDDIPPALYRSLGKGLAADVHRTYRYATHTHTHTHKHTHKHTHAHTHMHIHVYLSEIQ